MTTQKFYFIDLDGTIEDSRLDMANCVNKVRAQLGLEPWPLEKIFPLVIKGMDELYRSCFFDFIEHGHSQSAAKNTKETTKENAAGRFLKVKSFYEDCYLNACCVDTRCYEGIADALKSLSQKGKIIVVTNKPEKISRKLLSLLNLESLITDVMGGDSCAECKPSPLPLKLAAQKHHYNSGLNTCFMIGDSLADMKVAKAFGATAVWCAWGYSPSVPTERPDVIVNSPRELADL